MSVKKLVVSAALCMPFVVMAQAKKPTVKTTTKPAATKTTAAAVNTKALAASVERGKTVYMTSCLPCHQADGSGVPRLAPPVVKNDWVLGDKKRIVNMVLNGSSGKVEIDGEKFANAMPPHKHLTDEQIADVLTYVRNSFGNKASSVSPADVKAAR